MPRKKVTPEIVEEMRHLRAEGLSYDKIARRLELNPMTVYNHLRKEEGFFGWVKRKLGLKRSK